MPLSATLMILAAMLLVALLLKPLAERLSLPLAAMLILTGFIGSETMVYFGLDTGIDHVIFHDIIVYIFLPILVFAAAFNIDAYLLRKNLFAILFFAIPILLLSVGISASLIYFGIGHPEGFPWIAALITGAVLSSTDASPVTSLFNKFGIPKRLHILLDGEDMFNDATAIVIFGIFLYIALHPAEAITTTDVLIRFLIVFLGGGLIGLLVGLSFLFISRLFEDPIHQALVTIISAYSAFLLAKEILNVSGVMAVLITGLIMGRVIHNDLQDKRGSFVDGFWRFNVYVAEAMVFLLMGVVVTLSMFEERWLAMLIGIVAILGARAVGVFGAAPLLSRFPNVEPISRHYQQIMVMGSLRGAVVLALALALPTELDYWWTIQSIAFGVVIFSLFVQAPLIEPVLRRNKLAR